MTRFRLGLEKIKNRYDCVVGADPAGLTAALYLTRFNVDTTAVSEDISSKMTVAPLVDDYPGVSNVPGARLAELFVNYLRSTVFPWLLVKLL
jgi:thioredoxin reductase (NADPH)